MKYQYMIITMACICLMMLCYSKHICAKEKEKVDLIYNASKGVFESVTNLKVREGSIITVKVNNVNPFLHKAGVYVEQINAEYEDGRDPFNSVVGISKNEEKEAETKGEFLGRLIDFKRADSDEEIKTTTLSMWSKRVDKDFFELVEEADTEQLIKLNMFYRQKLQHLNTINTELKMSEINIQRIEKIMLADTAIKLAMKQPSNNSEERMREDIKRRTSMQFSNAKEIHDAFKTYLNGLYTNIYNIRNKLNALVEINRSINALDGEDFSDIIEEMYSKLEIFEKTYTGENLKVISDNINIIVNNYVTATGTNFFFIEKVIEANSDIIKIAIPNYNVDTITFTTHGGWRVDFSVGLAATYGDANGWKYTLNKVNDSTTYIITDKESRQILFSPVAFTHVYKRAKNNTQIMGSFGLAPDITDLANSKLYLGFSLGFTSTGSFARRWILSAGVCAGQADILKKKYRIADQSADRNIDSYGNISESDLTDKSIKAGAFVALSFNLGNN